MIDIQKVSASEHFMLDEMSKRILSEQDVTLLRRGFSGGWDAHKERHEGSQRAANVFCDTVTLRRQQESIAVGILRALAVAPNDPAIDAIIEVLNRAQPAPIVSHQRLDPSSIQYQKIHDAAEEWLRSYVKTASSKALSHGLQMKAAFASGVHWQIGLQPVADQPEIGAPISEMPLTGIVLDKLNQVIEMLQRQNNRTDEFAQGVEADFRKVMARADKIEEHTVILCDQIETDDKWFDGLSAKADEILGLMRPEKDSAMAALQNELNMFGSAYVHVDEDGEWKFIPLKNIQILPDAPEPADADETMSFGEFFAFVDKHNLCHVLSYDGLAKMDKWRKAKQLEQPSPATDESGQGAGFDAEHSADALSYMMTAKKFGKTEQQRMETVIRHQREQIGKLHAEISGLHDRERAIARKLGYPV